MPEEKFTGIKNGTIFKDGKPIGEIATKHSTFTKQGTATKSKISDLDLIKTNTIKNNIPKDETQKKKED